MEIHPVTGHFGAEIDHVDLANPLDPEIVRAIDRAVCSGSKIALLLRDCSRQ